MYSYIPITISIKSPIICVLGSEYFLMPVLRPGILGAVLLPLPASWTNKEQKTAQHVGVDLCMLFMFIQLHCEDLGEALDSAFKFQSD